MKLTPGIFPIALLLLYSIYADAQSLASFGDEVITREDFIQAFSKNNTDGKKTEKSVRDYLELYLRFKLKVKAAYEMHLDTLSSQKMELAEFSRQIADGYLKDEAGIKKLVDEAFQRSQKDIHLAHIYISSPAGPGRDADTLKAWKLASAAYNELLKGSDFQNVAGIYSEDTSVRTNHGDIGYITVFTLPYSLENIAYNTPVSKFSKPFRGNSGYHIIKNLGERKALGKIRVAQILLDYPPDATAAEMMVVKKRADSIYAALQNGAPFNKLAEQFHQSNSSYAANGEMPPIGVGEFEKAFEDAIFALKEDYQVSAPIEGPARYHIVQRLARIAIPSDSANDSTITELKRFVEADARISVARKELQKKMNDQTKLQKAALYPKDLWAYAESVLAAKKPFASGSISGNTKLFSVGNMNLTVGDWLTWIRSNGNDNTKIFGEQFAPLLDNYTELTVRDYYLGHLETYEPDYAYQVKEFKEGNLLFEVMQRTIWDKAAADSSGLRNYFDKNRNKYWWEPGIDGVIFNCIDNATALSLRTSLIKNKNWRQLTIPLEGSVQADSGRFELNQLPFIVKTTPAAGIITEPLKNNNDSNFSILYTVHVYTARTPRNFEESKGYVLSDYQAYLDEQWILELKKKYPVKVNEPLLSGIWK